VGDRERGNGDARCKKRAQSQPHVLFEMIPYLYNVDPLVPKNIRGAVAPPLFSTSPRPAGPHKKKRGVGLENRKQREDRTAHELSAQTFFVSQVPDSRASHRSPELFL